MELLAAMGGLLSESAKPTGKAQVAIMQAMETLRSGDTVELSDLTRGKDFLGVHFKSVQSAAAALAKKGMIKYDGTHAVTKL